MALRKCTGIHRQAPGMSLLLCSAMIMVSFDQPSLAGHRVQMPCNLAAALSANSEQCAHSSSAWSVMLFAFAGFGTAKLVPPLPDFFFCLKTV